MATPSRFNLPIDEKVSAAVSGTDKTKAGLDLAGPVVILVEPQLGENIGKAARAMLNFGLTEMRLVNPRDGWPNPDAGPAASGADRVLEQAQVYATTAAAVADCAHVYATTVRKRGVTKPVLTPEAAARETDLYFDAKELCGYEPTLVSWLKAGDE